MGQSFVRAWGWTQLKTSDMQEVEVKGKYPETLKTVQLW